MELFNVNLALGDRPVLCDVSVTMAPASVTAVIGPNGAGKSSLLRIASGELEPTSGTVRIDGLDLSEWDLTEIARRRAMLPQSSTLAFAFTAMEVVQLGRIPHRAAEDRRIAETALAEVGFSGFADRSFLTLSGGERQRVHLARVLAQIWPGGADRVLLLDEPTAALDLVHQHGTLGLARRLASRGATVVVVLHDLNLAARYAHRIVLLDRGRIVAEGAPHEVLSPPVLEPVFQLSLDVMELASPKQRVVLARHTPPMRSHDV